MKITVEKYYEIEKESNEYLRIIRAVIKRASSVKESAKTINKADEMQKKRQDAIKKSITTINQLMAKPINVEVKQLPMDNQNPGGGPLPSPDGQKPSADNPTAGITSGTTNDLNKEQETGTQKTGNRNKTSKVNSHPKGTPYRGNRNTPNT